MVVLEIEDKNMFDKVLEDAKTNGKLLVADFTASWCGPCKTIAPVLKTLADEHDSDFVVVKVDVDDNDELCKEYGITAMPTIIKFNRQGEKQETMQGANKEKLKLMFESK